MTLLPGSSSHLTDGELLRLALGWLPDARIEEALYHLVECSECCVRAARAERSEVRTWMKGTVAESLPALADEHLLSAAEFLPLLVLPPDRRRRRAVRMSLARRRQYFDLALSVSRSFWHSSGAFAHSAALDACAVAETAGMRPGARIRAGAFLMNALRVQRRFPEALRLLNQLKPRETAGDLLDRGWLNCLGAVVYRDLRQFDQCHQAAGIATECFTAHGQDAETAKVRLLVAEALIEQGQLEKAEESLEALANDPSFLENAPPELQEMLWHNWAYALVLQGKGFEACQLMRREAAQRGAAGTQPFFVLRRRWLEALIFQHMNQGERARQVFQQVRDSFLEKGMHYEAAQVALDLAMLTIQRGWNPKGAALLATELIPIYQAHGTGREAWMAFRLLVGSLEAHKATLNQVQEVIDALRNDQVAIRLT